MPSILRDAHNYAKKMDLYFPIFLVIMLVIIIAIVFSTHEKIGQTKTQSYKLNWERIEDSNGTYGLTIYRARIYGGWLVQTREGSITFISLNHPDGWVLEK